MTVQTVYDLINALAPFDTQADFDNSGLLVGSAGEEVSGILCALDVSEPVIREAVSLGANLIVTHHPIMFDARKRVTDADYEGRLLLSLIRNRISLIAAHTNLDQAPGGINDALARVCGLLDVKGEGFVRAGRLPSPMKAGELKSFLSAALRTDVRLMGDPEAPVSVLGMCSGAGGGEWEDAASLGADAFLSGEIRHHLALAMSDAGIPAFECGHYATEAPGIFALADALQSALNQVKCKVDVFKTATGAYAFRSRPGQTE